MQLYSSVSWGCGPLKSDWDWISLPRWPQHTAGRAVQARGGRPLFLSRWVLRLLGDPQDMVVNTTPEQEIQEETASYYAMMPRCDDVSLAHPHHRVSSILFTAGQSDDAGT